MDNVEQKNSISDKIIDKIKSGDIKMKPKISFILKIALLGLGAFFSFFFIIYLVSFIIFSLRASGVLFLPRFGFHGIGILFNSLPWVLVLIVAIFVVALEMFSKRLTSIYRKPIIYSLLAIIVLALAIGFLIERTSFHSNLFLSARDRHLPVMGPFYRNFGAPSVHNVNRGIVSEITDSGFKIETSCGETLVITITPQTRLYPGEKIEVGDEIVILGERNDGTVQSFEIHEIEKDFNLFPPDRIARDRLPCR